MNDRSFLTKKISDYKKLIKQKIDFIRICEIDNIVFDNKKYFFVKFKIFSKMNNKSAIVNFIKNVNIVNELKAKMFLDNDIIKLKNIMFNVDKNIVTINSC